MTVLLARGSGSGESKSEEREGMHRHFEDLELEHCSRATFYCSRQVTRLSQVPKHISWLVELGLESGCQRPYYLGVSHSNTLLLGSLVAEMSS